ncbi:MAG TPA: tetratricopeptide repeat protein [Pseudobacteroides sp.]|uniref:tetratricopeptide repeat protein n=1 Tax=Pseudobacteroides sp. TaxID=1968840 RepID=UPI002F949D7D
MYIKAKQDKSHNMPYLIERDDEITKFCNFLRNLPEMKRGVLRIAGFLHSGRTYFLNAIECVALQYNYEVISLLTNSCFKTKDHTEFLPDRDATQLDIGNISQKFAESLLTERLSCNKKNGIIMLADDIGQFDSEAINLLCRILNDKRYTNLALVYTNEPKIVKSLDYIGAPLYETINLGPLSPQGLRTWMRDKFYWEPQARFLEWFYNETMGLPGLIKDGIYYLLENDILIHDSKCGFVIKKDYSNVRLNIEKQRNNFRPKNNLPFSLTQFVGREDEIEKINNLLGRVRLVTLTGSGGIGKTRLALQIAFMRLYDYSDGVFFIPLSTATNADSIAANIAKSINIAEIQGQHIYNTLKGALYDKKCLIILDNFEHVIDAASIISELLTSTSGLTILVTSREPLRISGEHIFSVPPLEFVNFGEKAPIERVIQQPAVTLFLLRAKAVKPDFKITEKNAKEIIELCAYLEGIPLAIELAAANIGQISIHKMLYQSQNRLMWLNNGARDLEYRQRTLKNTIEWGYNLLNETQKKLFRRLGVFTGKFDLKAAHAITNCNNDIENLLETMASLLNKSFITKTAKIGGESEDRFSMLETIREYAGELLSISGEENYIKDCYSDYYLSLVTEAEFSMNGQERQRRLSELEFSHSNIINALKHLRMTNSLEKELKLTGAMGYFWEVRGYWNEGITILESLVQRYGSSIESKDYVKVFEWLGRLIHLQGNPEKSISIFRRSLSLAREIGDFMGEAAIQYKLSLAVSMLGNLEEEEKLANGSLSIYYQIDYKPGIAEVLQHLSLLYYQKGDYLKAEECSNESLKICKELKDKRGVAKALWRLGFVARGKGIYDEAMKMISEYLTYCEELDDKDGIANALISIAELSRSQSEYDIAEKYYMNALNLSYELGYKAIIARVLKDLGEIMRYRGDFNKAMELYKESLAVSEEIGSSGEIAWLYRNIAELELKAGDFLKAGELYLKGLNVFCDSKENTIMFVFLVLGGLAGVCVKLEKLGRSARLFGAADRLFNVVENLISQNDISEYTTRLEELRNIMDEGEFDKAWREGSQMSMEMAIDYAKEIIKDDKFEKNMANKMIDYIHINFSRDISLDEISGYFNMTPAYFSTVFKYYTGYNYKDYLNSYRVKVSKELLQNSNLKINEVAEKVGCNNVNTFIRIFKKYEGISPGQYYIENQEKT